MGGSKGGLQGNVTKLTSLGHPWGYTGGGRLNGKGGPADAPP